MLSKSCAYRGGERERADEFVKKRVTIFTCTLLPLESHWATVEYLQVTIEHLISWLIVTLEPLFQQWHFLR